MALRLRRGILFLWALLIVIGFSSNIILLTSANIVFKVHKTSNSNNTSLAALKNHDNRRHSRLLSSSSTIADLPLDGNGNPTGSALYYTKIGIGTPLVDYYVQVDTESDILWVNCTGCGKCATESDLGINLKLYDTKDSTTASLITCDQEFCTKTAKNIVDCKKNGSKCTYGVRYGDGSSSRGYFVKDNIQVNRVNGAIAFGCGDNQSGELTQSDRALDGILGFGQASSSMISQLSRDVKVKKLFSHCLNGNNGGGIFSIGQVMYPEMISTPLIPNQTHYNINLEGIEVGRVALRFSTDVIAPNSGKTVIIDSGTTLAYLEDDLYNPIIKEIVAAQPGLRLLSEQQFTCFQFSDNVDDGFPPVTFHFENSLSLAVYPHDYLFPLNEDVLQKNHWCLGWQRGIIQTNKGETFSLLGDMVLSNTMVVYDLEDMTIRWTEHNCSLSNEMKDEKPGEKSPVVYNDNSSYFATDLRNIWWFN